MPKRMRVVTGDDKSIPKVVASDNPKATPLTQNEIRARTITKYATTTTMGALGMKRFAGDVMDSAGGQYYSAQLATDFLEKP